MPTKLVLGARATPVSTLEQGVRATARLVTDPALQEVSGRYFDGLAEARAHAQAYDRDARRQLRERSKRLSRLA